MRNTSHWLLAATFALALACITPARAEVPARPLHDFVWLTRETVHDAMDNRDAFTLLVPKGWKAEANLAWRYDPFEPVASMTKVYNPNGVELVEQYPVLNFNDGIRQAAMRTAAVAGPGAVQHMAMLYADGNHYLGAEIRPQPASPREYLEKYLLPRCRLDVKDLQITGSDDEPQLAAAVLQQLGNAPGLNIKVTRIHTAYRVTDTDVDEDFIVILGTLPLPGNTVAWSGSGFSYRAKKGELANVMPIFRTIQDSLRVNLQWFSDIQQAKAIMQQIQVNELDQVMIRSKIIAGLQDHITRDMEETFLNRQKVQSRCNDEWDHVIRGSEAIPDPNHPGVTIHVPVGYDHIYVSGDGQQCIATNESSFKPDSVQGNFQEIHVK